MQITSPVFDNGGEIPVQYTCDGENLNPSLLIEDVPVEAESLAIILEDPGAPNGNLPAGRQAFTHWLLWNINPQTLEIEEGNSPEDAVIGENDAGEIGYTGPCPPDGTHSYFFKLYALDSVLEVSRGVTREELMKAIEPHILETAELVGKYTKQL